MDGSGPDYNHVQMRRHLVIAFVLGAWGLVLGAQEAGTRVQIPRSDLSKYLRNCSVENAADVQKEIKRQADRADGVEKVLGLAILVLTGDEGGKAELEGIPALLEKAQTGATIIGYWDKLMSWWAGNAKAQSFDVCVPAPGTIVVKPRKGALPITPAAGLAGGVPPRLFWNDFLKETTLASQCWSRSSVRSLMMPPYVTGRVVETTLLGKPSNVPAGSQWVSVSGPGYQRGCSSTTDGEFAFVGLAPGSYILYVGAVRAGTFQVDAHTNLDLGDVALPAGH